MAEFSEEHLAELIAVLPPPPKGWLAAACELPRARAAIDELTVLAAADQQARAVMLADLEHALRETGVEPRQQLLETLRARLSGLD